MGSFREPSFSCSAGFTAARRAYLYFVFENDPSGASVVRTLPVEQSSSRGRLNLTWPVRGRSRAPARGQGWFEPTWSRLRANYALYSASRGRIEDTLNELEVGRNLIPGISPQESITIIAPYVDDDVALLHRAAGDGEKAQEALARHLARNAGQ